MSQQEMRTKLREVFNKFDADKSGAISTEELGAIAKLLKLEVTPAKLKKMMMDADPDGSGEIDFEEFVVVFQKQMAAGGTEGLASLVLADSSFFGWLNPLSWFGASSGDEKAAKAAAKQEAESPASPGKYYATTPQLTKEQVTARYEGFTPTHRMKATQALVQAANSEVADLMKIEASRGKQRREQIHERFLERQRDKIEQTRQQVSRSHGAMPGRACSRAAESVAWEQRD